MELKVFVYGTLRNGWGNDRIVDRSLVKSWVDGTMRGRMWFAGGVGSYPYVKIPMQDWFWFGDEPELDVITWQEKIKVFKGHLQHPSNTPEGKGYWYTLKGEVITLEGTKEELTAQLARMDQLEGFHESSQHRERHYGSHYFRVATRVRVGNELQLTWVYVHGSHHNFEPSRHLIPSGDWAKEAAEERKKMDDMYRSQVEEEEQEDSTEEDGVLS